jgi:hypothetical protein
MSEASEKILARLILHLGDWAYDIFTEGDYSKEWNELKKWAAETLEAE